MNRNLSLQLMRETLNRGGALPGDKASQNRIGQGAGSNPARRGKSDALGRGHRGNLGRKTHVAEEEGKAYRTRGQKGEGAKIATNKRKVGGTEKTVGATMSVPVVAEGEDRQRQFLDPSFPETMSRENLRGKKRQRASAEGRKGRRHQGTGDAS